MAQKNILPPKSENADFVFVFQLNFGSGGRSDLLP